MYKNTVRKWLLLHGVAQKYRGFNDLVHGINMALINPAHLKNGVTKSLYPEIAKELFETPHSVERNIRSAIRQSGSSATNLAFITEAICDIKIGNEVPRTFYNYVGIIENGSIRFVTDYEQKDSAMCIRDGMNAHLFPRKQAEMALDHLLESGYVAVIVQAATDDDLVNPERRIKL